VKKYLTVIIFSFGLLVMSNQFTFAEDEEAKFQDVMRRLAEQSAASAEKNYKIKLDFTIESLAILERDLLSRMHKENIDTPISDEGLAARSIGLGLYVGEVIRRKIGGTWAQDSVAGEGTFPLTLSDGTQIFPVSWIAKRITEGSDEDIVFKTQTVLALVQGKKEPTTRP